MNTDFLNTWVEDNYKYLMVASMSTEADRKAVWKLANICEKHGVSFRAYCNILLDFGKEDTNAKN